MPQDYPSKIDWWLIAVFLAILGLEVALCVNFFVRDETCEGLTILAILVLIVGFFRAIVWPMTYRLADAELVIRAGFLRIRIAYQNILQAELSSNPLSSPALSLRRIHIDYRKKNGKPTYVLISPIDRHEFLRCLAEKTGRHRLEGDRMIPNTVASA